MRSWKKHLFTSSIDKTGKRGYRKDNVAQLKAYTSHKLLRYQQKCPDGATSTTRATKTVKALDLVQISLNAFFSRFLTTFKHI